MQKKTVARSEIGAGRDEFFGVEHVTISKGACSTLTVKEKSNMLKYKYWFADSTREYKCPKELWVEEQGDSAGGGEMGGGS